MDPYSQCRRCGKPRCSMAAGCPNLGFCSLACERAYYGRGWKCSIVYNHKPYPDDPDGQLYMAYMQTPEEEE